MTRGSAPALVGERGAGSVLVLAVASVALTLAVLCVPLNRGLVLKGRAASAAAASAVAAADTAIGILPGDPCASARSLARENGARIEVCAVDGVVVTVTVSASEGVLVARAMATAGPAGAAVALIHQRTHRGHGGGE